MIDLYKEIFFSITTIIFITLYLVSAIYSIVNITGNADKLEPKLLHLICLTLLGTCVTIPACLDWLIHKQFMRLSWQTNFIWFAHHTLTPFLYIKLNTYAIEKTKIKYEEFCQNIKHFLKITEPSSWQQQLQKQ